MGTLDSLMERFGHGSVGYGVQGTEKKWALRKEFVSPCYTTNLNDILRAQQVIELEGLQYVYEINRRHWKFLLT
ncbi:DUF4113 domain-containing protein [Pontibacter sp. 13R65]|uniref:DUF4113 domain-containing protein n=1 Tax=Pontibacter sp. 13R65 TaxID=3127458 RepID=UPI0039C955BD